MRRLRQLILALSVLGLVVVPAAMALKIDATPPPNGEVGKAYSFRFQPEAGQGCTPYEFKFLTGALPPGLSIASDGTMSGTPTTVGDYTVLRRDEELRGQHDPAAILDDDHRGCSQAHHHGT